MEEIINTPAVAKVTTMELTPAQRALGRSTRLALHPSKGAHADSKAEMDLAADSFWEYYLSDPHSKPEVPPERILNRKMLDWAKEGANWDNGRQVAVGSSTISALSAGFLAENLMTEESLKEAFEKQRKAEESAQKAQQAQQQAQALQQQADIINQQAKQSNDPAAKQQAQALQQQAGQAQNQAKALAKQTEALAQDAVNSFEKNVGKPGARNDLANAMRANAVQQANQKTEQAVETLSGWGLDPGSDGIEEIQDALSILQTMPNMAEMASLIGRVKGIALKAKTNKKGGFSPIPQDAGYTRDLMAAFPNEVALLRPDAPPLVRAQKVAEFCQRGLLGLIPVKEEVKEGGLTIARDASGSMGGIKNTYATAISLGLAQASKENGQPYNLFSFASERDPIYEVSSDEDWKAHLDWATRFQSGGTSFDKAMQKAMDLVRASEKSENTDIVMITDAQSAVSTSVASQYREMRSTLGTRLIFLLVGNESNIRGLEGLIDATLVMFKDNCNEVIDDPAQALSEILNTAREGREA